MVDPQFSLQNVLLQSPPEHLQPVIYGTFTGLNFLADLLIVAAQIDTCIH